MIPKADSQYKKESYRSISLVKLDIKIYNKILAN